MRLTTFCIMSGLSAGGYGRNFWDSVIGWGAGFYGGFEGVVYENQSMKLNQPQHEKHFLGE